MESISDLNGVPTPEYCGCILSGGFSVELKKRVAEYIDRYRSFEATGSAAILYIAAWQGEKEKIWYEYASQKFMNLFCHLSNFLTQNILWFLILMKH